VPWSSRNVAAEAIVALFVDALYIALPGPTRQPSFLKGSVSKAAESETASWALSRSRGGVRVRGGIGEALIVNDYRLNCLRDAPIPPFADGGIDEKRQKMPTSKGPR
jgi:hypothetical protein